MTKAQKALIKKRKRCTYCKKLISASHMRWMGDVTGCSISWTCECNRLPYPASMDREWFEVHEICFCCGIKAVQVNLTNLNPKRTKLIDLSKAFKDCKWHAESAPPMYSWAPAEEI